MIQLSKYLYLYHNKICVNSIISKFDEDLNLHDSYKDYIIEDKNELNKIFKDKYYIQSKVLYKCIRDSGQPLSPNLSDLVGNYVEKA